MQTAIGQTRHRVQFQAPVGPAVPDGDGGYTQAWADLSPASWFVSIEPITGRDLERLAVGTVISQATHLVRGRWHAGVTTATRMVFAGRLFSVTGVANRDERGIEMELIVVEVVP